MKNGLYEKIIHSLSSLDLEDKNYKDFRSVDDSELAKVISIEYQNIIRSYLSRLNTTSEKVAMLNKINRTLGIEDFHLNGDKVSELLAVHHEKKEFNNLKDYRPRTSIANSTLFTGHSGPTLESELSREIRTADEVYFLVSFIKFSGLRLIYDDLVEFTKKNKLKIITTSYMGASDYKAILELSKLPNTELKISYDTKRTRLHAKAYFFKRNTGFSTAYIGSSNLSNPALSNGLEWNLKVSEYTSKDVVDSFVKTFESYWNDEEFISFVASDEDNRKKLKLSLLQGDKKETSNIFFDLRPYSHQREILEDLKVERQEYGSYKNLVVAATGTGKTMIAAFDYKDFAKGSDKKLLFLAHRKEILEQSLYTFRNVLKDQNFGELFVDGFYPDEKNHIFASVQTLNSQEKYKEFSSDYFDYIVIDESHHLSSSTYLNILKYYEPTILLGLTATPERMDGKNILEYYNNRIASEIRLSDAIDRKLLSPFHYFGVTDSEDLSNLKWSRGGYDISELENVYTKSKQRVQTILDSMDKYLKDVNSVKAVGFCVSIKHAEFMANSFNSVGIASVALHSSSSKEERNLSKKRLEKGDLNCIFTVDLFNEGVDIPDIDTVLFLRPTESLTVFIQQLGRGLRLSENKDALTVLDFVGQSHANYDFTFKLRALTGKTKNNIRDEINNEFPNMPAGCHIKLEKIAKEHILNNIQSSIFNIRDLRNMIKNFSINFSNQLTLTNFFHNYGIDKNRFYSKYSFYELLFESGLKKSYNVRDRLNLNQALRKFSRINSKRLLDFSKTLLSHDLDISKFSNKERLLLGMFHYTIWGTIPDISYEDSLYKLKKYNGDLVLELLDIIDYNKKNLKILEFEYEDSSVPLDIYAEYNLDQIMVAFGKTTENHKFPIRQGVLYIKEKNTDLFFITINKSEEDYLPSTMYNDYAKNRELFNWESQSTTSIESPTGQRYVNNKDPDHKVLLFVREYKKEYGLASPYNFLGNACYVSHQGSNPIEILWKMDHPIPERIIRESKLRVVR